MTRPKYPPYRETGGAIPLSHCVSYGIAHNRCYTPTSFLKNRPLQSKDRPNKGVSQEKLASEAYRAIGGVARNAFANRAIVGHWVGAISLDGVGTTPIPIKWGNSDQNSDHGEFEPPEIKSTVSRSVEKRSSDHGPSFLPGKTKTMVRVNCQNGDGGGSWVGAISLQNSKEIAESKMYRACMSRTSQCPFGVLRGNTIRGNTTRSSERKMALWEGLWEGLWKTSENL